MSKLRMFPKAQHAVRLPALPRQVVFLVLLINIIGFGLTIPYIIGEWTNRTMRETVAQAGVLAQITEMQDLTGRRAMQETRALRMAGFELHTAEAAAPSLVWLVASPQPQPEFEEIDLTHAGIMSGIMASAQIFRRPPEAQFAITDRKMVNGDYVRAIASYGVWQEYIGAIVLRIMLAFIGVCVVFVLLFRTFFRRLMLQSLDDLFVRLYGSAAMGISDVNDAQSLLASLDAFQDRMRHHIDEQARLAALGAGASFLAHDIRNLLASLQLNAEQLMDLPGEKEQRIGKRLATAIEQSLSLVEWAALYTSNKRDHLDVQRQPLRPIIDDALNFVRLHDPRRRVQLVNDCLANVDVVAERTLMFRILYNLALNAVQAMQGQETLRQIRIRAANDDRACIIRVSDSGPGLPGEGRGSLLMPHMSGARRPDGTGLGLKIVTDLVSWHGGRLDIIHSDGHGTQFQITLPHHAPGAPRDEADGDEAAALEASPSLSAEA